MVNKQRFPNKLTVSGRSINIRDKGTAQVVKIQFRTIVLQHFGKTHGNGLSFLPRSFTCCIPTIFCPISTIYLPSPYRFNGYWLYFLHHLQTRRELCHKFSFGSLHPFGRFPSGIIIAAFRPFAQFQAGIIPLTVKLVVCGYRTQFVTFQESSLATDTVSPLSYSIFNCAMRRGKPKPTIHWHAWKDTGRCPEPRLSYWYRTSTRG